MKTPVGSQPEVGTEGVLRKVAKTCEKSAKTLFLPYTFWKFSQSSTGRKNAPFGGAYFSSPP